MRAVGTRRRSRRQLQQIREAAQAWREANAGLQANQLQDARAADATLQLIGIAAAAAAEELGLEARDGQLTAAVALTGRNIVQMSTGEGKTLAGALAAVALANRYGQVTVITANSYLARRDADLLEPLYRRLGLRVAHTDRTDAERQEAWRADVVHTDLLSLGVDLLQDMSATDPAQLMSPPLQAVIVDEADAVLLDQAGEELSVSVMEESREAEVRQALKAAAQLQREAHLHVDEADRSILLTDEGIRTVERLLQLDGDLYSSRNGGWAELVVEAAAVLHLQQRGVHYLVERGRILPLDQQTGRVKEGQRFQGITQQLLETKERLRISRDSLPVGRINVRQLLGHAPQLSGMTGTAADAGEELQETWEAGIVRIDDHRPSGRTLDPDVLHISGDIRDRQVAEMAEVSRQAGRPVLIGCGSVTDSERISALLRRQRIPHRLLNATSRREEAAIIAEAGREGAVTVATSMAGRGVDIILGRDRAERDRIIAAGGMHVIGVGRNRSRRVDEQLQGRCGRGGDPGQVSFLLAADDDLLRLYGGVSSILAGMSAGGSLQGRPVERAVRRAQRRLEGVAWSGRKEQGRRGAVLEAQRQQYLRLRAQPLHAGDLEELQRLDLTWRAHMRDVQQILQAGGKPDLLHASWEAAMRQEGDR